MENKNTEFELTDSGMQDKPKTDKSSGRAKAVSLVKKTLDVKRLTGMAVFAALAYAVTFVFRIPVSFLTFDAKDAVLTVASFIYGPIAALIMALIPALIEFITISDTGFWGFLMNFVSSACFAFTASLIYKFKRSFFGAILASGLTVVSVTGVMLLANVFITPLYFQMPTQAVIDMLPTVLLPFNLCKTVLNASIMLLVYKPFTTALKKSGFLKASDNSAFKFNKKSVLLTVVAVLLILAAVVVLLTLGIEIKNS